MPVHIPLLYGEVPLGAHQTCSWGVIKRDVQRQTRQDVHIYPLSTVAQGILGVQRKSNWVDTFRLELEHKATCIMMTQLWRLGWQSRLCSGDNGEEWGAVDLFSALCFSWCWREFNLWDSWHFWGWFVAETYSEICITKSQKCLDLKEP